ncbi:MAG TPA: hypothetical protein DCM24_04295 [Synergistaceae bacterium]|nr:hypothetical protein [Synergistaceae bacterium]
MIVAWVLAVLLFSLSWLTDRERSLEAARSAWSLFRGILPMFVIVMVLTSLSFGLISEEVLLELLIGRGLLAGSVIGAAAGSVAAIPGFVAFPLSGILLGKGVPYTVIAAFTTTLMMVGVVTFPLERQYLGARAALVRNLAGLTMALVVSVAVGIFFGELP